MRGNQTRYDCTVRHHVGVYYTQFITAAAIYFTSSSMTMIMECVKRIVGVVGGRWAQSVKPDST